MTLPGPNKQDPSLTPQSLQSALDMDPSQSSQQPNTQPSRKRKKTDANGDEPAEPRRLRRSHEACARCRSKKIKASSLHASGDTDGNFQLACSRIDVQSYHPQCDSKYPRCTACATAGTPCHQEDRHRQTLIPRGHTERVVYQLKQCEALLRQHIQNFDLEALDEICAQKGIHIDAENPDAPATANPNFQFQPPPGARYPPPQPPPKGYPYAVHPHMVPPPYAGGPVPYGAPYPPQMIHGPAGPYPPHMHSEYQPPPHVHQPESMPSLPLDTPGRDPKRNDMTSTQTLAKNFGVTEEVMEQTKVYEYVQDNEDFAVGSSGLSSGRDRRINEASLPREATKWMAVELPREFVETPSTMSPPLPSIRIWLPRDRNTAKRVVDVYFERLNYHRPALDQADFENDLNALYEGEINIQRHNQGFICTMYLVFALGTLNEVNHRAFLDAESPAASPTVKKKYQLEGWPDHDEFFEWGLFYKPEIQATISALQALILLHWYLYTERQGRTLWRFVGGIVRLAIELGLHHDPSTQGVFTEEMSQLRIRLWGIVIVHDRGTSILLGRPLGIAPYDSSTSRPTRSKSRLISDCSEHFVLSHPVAEIQADIINSLYTPTSQSLDTIIRQASRITRIMVEFKSQLPEKYQRIFLGSEHLPIDQQSKLIENISADEGLTLLKIQISRILLLRNLFSSDHLAIEQKHKCLSDAVVTAHNVIIIHNHLIRFPDIGFFVSPIPLHIAAMVILYGRFNKCATRLSRETEIQDIWMALDVLPRMRWRWARKDVNGEHPLITHLAEKILEVKLHGYQPKGDNNYLLSDNHWDLDLSSIPPAMGSQKQEQMTPVMANSSFPVQNGYSPHNRRVVQNSPMVGMKNEDKKSPSVPTIPPSLFYPFYPEDKIPENPNGTPQDFQELLVAAASRGGQYSTGSYRSEHVVNRSNVPLQWSHGNSPRGPQYPIVPH